MWDIVNKFVPPQYRFCLYYLPFLTFGGQEEKAKARGEDPKRETSYSGTLLTHQAINANASMASMPS
jgi:hypothetical protein